MADEADVVRPVPTPWTVETFPQANGSIVVRIHTVVGMIVLAATAEELTGIGEALIAGAKEHPRLVVPAPHVEKILDDIQRNGEGRRG